MNTILVFSIPFAVGLFLAIILLVAWVCTENYIVPPPSEPKKIMSSFDTTILNCKKAVEDFFALNPPANGRKDYYKISITKFKNVGNFYEIGVYLTFRSGEKYCCPLPECHHGLNEPKSRCWLRLRDCFEKYKVIPPFMGWNQRELKVSITPYIEAGAIFESYNGWPTQNDSTWPTKTYKWDQGEVIF